MRTTRVVLATANPSKAAEINEILGELGVTVVPRPPDLPDVDETGATLLDNARLKARAVCEATGEAALADDTGLEVDALGGAPGVHTARFAGPDATHEQNLAKLLEALEGLPPSERGATFRTVIVLARPDGTELVAEGVVRGTIPAAPHGDEGWGYDPVFEPEGFGGRTYAELGPLKNHVSHRGRAVRAFVEAWRASGDGLAHDEAHEPGHDGQQQ